MGFVLLAFSVGGFEGVQVKFYYLIVYMISSLCIWSIILNLKCSQSLKNFVQSGERVRPNVASAITMIMMKMNSPTMRSKEFPSKS